RPCRAAVTMTTVAVTTMAGTAAEGIQDVVLGIDEAEIDSVLFGAFVLLVLLTVRRRVFRVGLLDQALADRFFDRAERHGRGTVRKALHGFDAVLLQDALHPADGIALAVEKPADALEQVDVVGAVIAPPPAPLHRLDLREARLPEPQHMLGNVEVASDLADGS